MSLWSVRSKKRTASALTPPVSNDEDAECVLNPAWYFYRADVFSNKRTQASPKKQRLTPSQKVQFQGSAKKVVPIRDLAADAKVSTYASYLFLFWICELIFETVVKAKLSSMILTAVKTLQTFSSKDLLFWHHQATTDYHFRNISRPKPRPKTKLVPEVVIPVYVSIILPLCTLWHFFWLSIEGRKQPKCLLRIATLMPMWRRCLGNWFLIYYAVKFVYLNFQ
jgi:hypothetical protein